MKEEFDPYLVAFDNIKNNENTLFQNDSMSEDEIMADANQNNIKENEDEEIKDENKINGNQQILNENENKNENISPYGINQNEITNKLNDQNYKNNESNNTINFVIPTKTVKKENKISKEYDYGYKIIYINDDETGIMEDFVNDNSNESTTKDSFNFGLDENKWIKFLNHSILVHYKKKYNEYIEKQNQLKKFQNMYMNNGTNINANNDPHGIMSGMKPYMINYYQNMNMNMNNMNMNNMKNNMN